MSNLQKLGIVIGNDKLASTLFEKLCPDFRSVRYTNPSDYVGQLWNIYSAYAEKNSNLNGRIFEYILSTLLIRENIIPFYLSAKVAFVPNIIYDIMLYTKELGPICISAKTSLRERYKQADLEAIALKYVHRKSPSFLVTLHAAEAASVKAKIKSGDVIGLDDVVVATSSEFDQLILQLKQYELSEPPVIKVIESNQIVTREKLLNLDQL